MAAGSKHGRGAEQVSLRLPNGLRDRIRTYADKHGRSMNAEIIRLLEARYPEPWPVEKRIGDLLRMVSVLKGAATNEHIDQLNNALLETVDGIINGRVVGLTQEQRDRVAQTLKYWSEEEAENEQLRATWHLDDEELDALHSGRSIENAGFDGSIGDLDDEPSK